MDGNLIKTFSVAVKYRTSSVLPIDAVFLLVCVIGVLTYPRSPWLWKVFNFIFPNEFFSVTKSFHKLSRLLNLISFASAHYPSETGLKSAICTMII